MAMMTNTFTLIITGPCLSLWTQVKSERKRVRERARERTEKAGRHMWRLDCLGGASPSFEGMYRTCLCLCGHLTSVVCDASEDYNHRG